MNLKLKSKMIAKTCKQVRRHFPALRCTAANYRGLQRSKIMPFVLRYSAENEVLPAVIYKIIGSDFENVNR